MMKHFRDPYFWFTYLLTLFCAAIVFATFKYVEHIL